MGEATGAILAGKEILVRLPCFVRCHAAFQCIRLLRDHRALHLLLKCRAHAGIASLDDARPGDPLAGLDHILARTDRRLADSFGDLLPAGVLQIDLRPPVARGEHYRRPYAKHDAVHSFLPSFPHITLERSNSDHINDQLSVGATFRKPRAIRGNETR
jgi:hypothetical protein